MFADLPADVAGLARTVQGLLLHEHVAPAYGVELSDTWRSQTHTRSAKDMLRLVAKQDAQPISSARPLNDRIVGTCRNFTVLAVSMLRAQGIPARARCGFGTFFQQGQFVDHWEAEYWNEELGRWVLMDAQLDELQRGLFQTDFDTLDVPRDKFVIAGDAWAMCRAGEADPQAFGIMEMRGLWFVAGNVIRDAAALNNMEMLPWDCWGAMSAGEGPLSEPVIAFIDELAALTREPDANFVRLRELYESSDQLRVPEMVFNAVLNRAEPWQQTAVPSAR